MFNQRHPRADSGIADDLDDFPGSAAIGAIVLSFLFAAAMAFRAGDFTGLE
jgi:hypothetical protein